MNKRTLGIAVLAMIHGLLAQAATLATYDFTGNSGDQPTPAKSVGPHLSTSDISFGPGLSPAVVPDWMVASGFATGGAESELDVEDNDYWELTLTPEAGHKLTVESITFNYMRAKSGPQNLVIRTSVDGYGANASETRTAIPTGFHDMSFRLRGISDRTGAVTIRLYGYGALVGRSAGQLTNRSLFVVHGTVSPASSIARSSADAKASARFGAVR